MTENYESCPYCGGTSCGLIDEVTTSSGEVFSIRRCTVCHAAFLAPLPTAQQLAAAYDESYYGEGKTKFFGPIEAVVKWYRRSRARKLARLLPPSASVLDIGCGAGDFLAYLGEMGIRGTGVEREGPAADRAGKLSGVTLIRGEFTPSMFRNESFDAVTLWHVLEHLSNTREVIPALPKLVRKNGYLMISLPNIESIQSRFFRDRWFHLDPPRHLIFFPEQTLIQELKKTGFRHVKTDFYSLEHNPFGIFQSLLNRGGISRDSLYESFKRNNGFMRNSSRAGLVFQKLLFVLTFPLFALLAAIESACGRGGTMELTFQKE